MGMNAIHRKWQDVPLETLSDSITRRFITTDRQMVAQFTLPKGAVVPAHRHENEQVTNVLSGVMEFTLGDDQNEIVIVRANEVIVLPSNLLHSARILEDCFQLDIFSPPRADWLQGEDHYLRGG